MVNETKKIVCRQLYFKKLIDTVTTVTVGTGCHIILMKSRWEKILDWSVMFSGSQFSNSLYNIYFPKMTTNQQSLGLQLIAWIKKFIKLSSYS